MCGPSWGVAARRNGSGLNRQTGYAGSAAAPAVNQRAGPAEIHVHAAILRLVGNVIENRDGRPARLQPVHVKGDREQRSLVGIKPSGRWADSVRNSPRTSVFRRRSADEKTSMLSVLASRVRGPKTRPLCQPALLIHSILRSGRANRLQRVCRLQRFRKRVSLALGAVLSGRLAVRAAMPRPGRGAAYAALVNQCPLAIEWAASEVIGYGIYDPPHNRGAVCAGISHDTPASPPIPSPSRSPTTLPAPPDGIPSIIASGTTPVHPICKVNFESALSAPLIPRVPPVVVLCL